MKVRSRLVALLLSLSIAAPALLSPGEARAQGAEAAEAAERRAPSLALSEVISSAEQLHPSVLAAEQERAAAAGAALEAEGGFDLMVRARAATVPFGYYNNTRVETTLEQPTAAWGTRVFAGWRLGRGEFPIYDGKLETNSLGEARAGVVVPLLRGGSTDPRRAAVARAAAGRAEAEAIIDEKRLDVQRQAAARYWGWVAAGQKLAIAQRLLERASVRDLGIASRVERGDLPEIERVENQRAILQRKGQLVAAERALDQASIALSLFLRDETGQPVAPSPERLPQAMPEPSRPAGAVADTQARALAQRPEQRRMAAARRALATDEALARNLRLPSLDVHVTASRDLGQGSPTREPTELEAAVVLELPLQQRAASGKLAQTEAKIGKLEAERRLFRDRTLAEVRDARSALSAAFARVGVARGELAVARQLESAERSKFELGEGTLLLVNLREQATAEADSRVADALADYHAASAALRAASGERPDGR